MRQESGQICARRTSALAYPRGWRPAAIAVLTLVASAGPLLAQQASRAVSGTVVSAATLTPIQGADVRVQGS